MRKLIHGDILGHYNIPNLLQLHDVSFLQLRLLRVSNKPALLKALMIAFIKDRMALRKSLIGDRQLAAVRHFNIRRESHLEPRTVCQALLRAAHFSDDTTKQLQEWVRERVDEGNFYECDDGSVKSRIGGGFSYSQDEELQLSDYQTVTCPDCASEETLWGPDDVIPDLVSVSRQFTHLSGPYCRCESCDKVVRPVVSEATSIPDGNYEGRADDAWDNYVEHLGYLLTEMKDHMSQGLGVTAPAGLRLEGRNLNWRGSDGYLETAAEGDKLAEAMSVNGDFSVRNGRLWLEPDGTASLTCTMYHHDAPTGSSFTVTPYWECELDEERQIDASEVAKAKHNAKLADALLCGSRQEFRYNVGDGPFKLVSAESLSEELRILQRNVELQEALVRAEVAEDTREALGAAVGLLIESLIDAIDEGTAISVPYAKGVRKLIDCYVDNRPL